MSNKVLEEKLSDISNSSNDEKRVTGELEIMAETAEEFELSSSDDQESFSQKDYEMILSIINNDTNFLRGSLHYFDDFLPEKTICIERKKNRHVILEMEAEEISVDKLDEENDVNRDVIFTKENPEFRYDLKNRLLAYVYKTSETGIYVEDFYECERDENEGLHFNSKYSYDEVKDNIASKEYAENLDKLCNVMRRYCKSLPKMTLIAFEFALDEGEVRLARILKKPAYPVDYGFGKGLSTYLTYVCKKAVLKRSKSSNKMVRTVQRYTRNFEALMLIGRGFTLRNAKKWISIKYIDKAMSDEPKSTIKWAHKHGFTVKQVKDYGINESNYKQFISERDYLNVMPINLKYQKWLRNAVNTCHVFKPFREQMPDFFYHCMRRDGQQFFIPLNPKFEYTDSPFMTIKKILEEYKRLDILSMRGHLVKKMSYENGQYKIGTRVVELWEIEEIIKSIKGEFLLGHRFPREDFEKSKSKLEYLTLIVYNSTGKNGTIGKAWVNKTINHSQEKGHIDLGSGTYVLSDHKERTVACWEKIKSTVDEMCKYTPQLEFFGIKIAVKGKDFIIQDIYNYPNYSTALPADKKMEDFILSKVKEKNDYYASFKNRFDRMYDVVKRTIRKKFAKKFYPKDLVPYISVTWIRDVFQDFMTNKECSFKKKIWAYKHGFLSYRLDQYGITEENWQNYIADFEYKWLRHINPPYKEWLEDKLTLKYIATDFKQYFPEYYYQVVCKNGEINIIPLVDCPKGYKADWESVIRIIQEKGSMALKPDEGSHGNGFFRCDYTDGKYYLNYEEATEEEVINVLSQKESSYIITEYIQMHPQLKEIYSGSVNTIRMIVFKKNGVDPQIGNAYMRIGSSKTGAIDNMAAGGMFAQINVDTGEYGNSKIFVDGAIQDCDRHPDTNVLIQGLLPNWDHTKELVLKIARAIPELEYFGFDLAITEDGIKIPEINRFPDYPKIEKFNPSTIDYLLYKLEKKKARTKYNARKKTLIKLPKRDSDE